MNRRDNPTVTVTEKCRKRTTFGHPWIYDNEIISSDSMSDGSIADVVSEKGKYVGTGFYNSASKIAVRIISRNTNDKFDEDFFRRRVAYAWQYRKSVMPMSDLSAARLIFSLGSLLTALRICFLCRYSLSARICAAI